MSLGRSIEIFDVSSFVDAAPRRPAPPRAGEGSGAAYAPALDAEYEQLLSSGVSLEQYLDQCEKEYLGYALRKHQNSYKVAELLRTSQSSIIRRKKKYFL
ncbi:hypothetical protein SDC9_161002 [bioreactor metagenome]|uniref:TyrR-like helix-turn-helix domain-containing protein n=1 Tax=bioreactor metagenome TaxID=1076179 RepID=A0A645FK09_9ZZZZ